MTDERMQYLNNKLQEFIEHPVAGLEDMHEYITIQDVVDLIEEVEALNSVVEMYSHLSDNDDKAYALLLEEYKILEEENEQLKIQLEKIKDDKNLYMNLFIKKQLEE